MLHIDGSQDATGMQASIAKPRPQNNRKTACPDGRAACTPAPVAVDYSDFFRPRATGGLLPVTPAVRVKRMASSIFMSSGRTALRGISTA